MRTIMTMVAKCSDAFWATVRKENGDMIGQYEGYVPDFFPNEHYGDYVEFTIDIDTGQILNWQKPTKKDLKIFQP